MNVTCQEKVAIFFLRLYDYTGTMKNTQKYHIGYFCHGWRL
jgi:hypothetical protein